MKLSEVQEMWAGDSKIDELNLAENPQKHQNYMQSI